MKISFIHLINFCVDKPRSSSRFPRRSTWSNGQAACRL